MYNQNSLYNNQWQQQSSQFPPNQYNNQTMNNMYYQQPSQTANFHNHQNFNASHQNYNTNINYNQKPQLQSSSTLQYKPSDLQPYNNQQFLCKTFNYKVQYIQAFLALPSQLKLKFYISLEQAKLYGQIKDRQGYQTILQKIVIAAKIIQGKPLTEQQRNLQKPKSMEDKINQLCDYQFAKLHVSDKNGKIQQEQQFQNYVSSIENNCANGTQNQIKANDQTKKVIQKQQDLFAVLDFSNSNQQSSKINSFLEAQSSKQSNQYTKKTQDEDDEFGDFNDYSNNTSQIVTKKNDNLLQDQDFQSTSIKNQQNLIPTFDQLYPNSQKIDAINIQRPKFAWMQKLNQQQTFKVGIFDLDLDDQNNLSKKKSQQKKIEDYNNILLGNNSNNFAQPTYKHESQLNQISLQNKEDDQEFDDFTGGQQVKPQNLKQQFNNTQKDSFINSVIDFKSAYQSYSCSKIEENQSVILYQQDKKQNKNNKQHAFIQIENDTSFNVNQNDTQNYYQTQKQMNNQIKNPIIDDYDMMWSSISLPNNNNSSVLNYQIKQQDQFYDGSLIQVDVFSQTNNLNKNQIELQKQNKLDQQQQWEDAVQTSKQVQLPQQKHQKLNSPQIIQINQLYNSSQIIQNDQSKPIKKIKKPENTSYNNFQQKQQFENKNHHQQQQQQFGDFTQNKIPFSLNTNTNNINQSISENQSKKNQQNSNSLKLQQKNVNAQFKDKTQAIVVPKRRQTKLQSISSNISVCIMKQQTISPVSSKISKNQNKSQIIDNQFQSSIDSNNAGNSKSNCNQMQYFDQNSVKQKSQVSSPGIKLSHVNSEMNKTAVFNSKTTSKLPSQVQSHPLLKPLTIQYSINNIATQLKGNSFQCNSEFYQNAIQWIQKLMFQNGQLYNHLKSQLETVYEIKKFTQLYTKAVEQDQQEKVMQALKQSKKLYKQLHAEKTKKMINFYLKRGNKTLYYDLAQFLIQKGNISIQLIQKQLPTKSADSFPYVLVSLYVLQKNNLMQSIPIYAAKLITYILRQYQSFKQNNDNLKSMNYEQQQKVIKTDKYREYIKGLGMIAIICRRICSLGKICSKTMGSLVKVLKVSKQLENQAHQYLNQNLNSQGKKESLRQLWTLQANQRIIPNKYSQFLLQQLKMHKDSSQIQNNLDNLITSNPVCRLCLGSENLQQKQGIKIHSQCYNLYRTVNSQIQQ